MQYKNFDLCIDDKAGDVYQVRAESESMGETEGSLSLAADWLSIAANLKNVKNTSIGNELETLGTSLHQGLFGDKVGDLLRMSLGDVLLDDDHGMRIRLVFTPPELAALPWEFLYDQRSRSFLSTSGKTPLTRYIKLFEPIRSLKIVPPVRVLVLIPEGSGLDVEKETQLITKALEGLEGVEVRILKGVTRSKISDALLEKQYHILHFIGHGTFQNEQGYLAINSDNGDHDFISADTFADFFKDSNSMKLVVLNSCQGAEVSSTRPLAGMAPQLVARGIPAVIAMQYPISDTAALVFAKEFYLKLCKGWSRGQVDAAISHARNRIHMDVGEPLAFATPVLFMRSPTGVIFDLQEASDPDGFLKKTVKNFFGIFTSTPVKNISRLNQIKQTHQKNIEAWQEKTKDAAPGAAAEMAQAIAQEKVEIDEVESRIAKWRRTFAASLLATVIVFLLGYVGLFNFPFRFDDWLESRFIPYMDDYVSKKFNPNIRLIMAAEDDNGGLGQPGPNWRGYNAEVIEGLAKAGAKVVVLDVEMHGPSDFDDQLARAIERAKGLGTQVVTGTRIEDDGTITQDVPDELASVLRDRFGNINVGRLDGGFVREYQLAQPDRERSNPQAREVPLLPSLSLLAVSSYLSNDSSIIAVFNKDYDTIQLRSNGSEVKSIPVNENELSLYDFPYDLADRSRLKSATKPYREVYARRNDPASLRDYQNKIVLIGYERRDTNFGVLQGENRFGTEIHANVISNILGSIYIQKLPDIFDFLIVAVMAGAGALIQTKFRHVFSTQFSIGKKTIDVPGLLFLTDIVYLLIAFLVYKNGLIYIVKSYHLAAPFITYWLAGKMRKRSTLKAS